MRRFDKKKHIEKINKRLNENRFSWNGEYANEEVNEDDTDDYNYPFNAGTTSDGDENITDPYELREKVVGLGDDLEFVDEDCGCKLDEDCEPTDVEKSQWFSDVDGSRLTDKEMDN